MAILANLWTIWKRALGILAGFAVCVEVAGAVMNKAVTLANHGFMPVVGGYCRYFPGFIIDETHACAGSSSRLLYLADRFEIGQLLYSLGDLIGFTGYGLALIAGTMLLMSLPLFVAEKIRARIR